MTRRQIQRRWRSRLGVDERGFTIVETVAALGIMFMLLMSLAYVVTSGLTYQRAARIRQTANGLANQVMEQIRGLPYEAIQDGMRSADLADGNIVSCSGTYRLLRVHRIGVVDPGHRRSDRAQSGPSDDHPARPARGDQHGGRRRLRVVDLRVPGRRLRRRRSRAVPRHRGGRLDRRDGGQARSHPEPVLVAVGMPQPRDAPVRGTVPGVLLREGDRPGRDDLDRPDIVHGRPEQHAVRRG